MREEQNHNQQDEPDVPSGLVWGIRRFGWFLEKYVLWPIGDSFRRIANAFRYRSPFAYISATLLVTVTAGAVAAAVYFYNQAEDKDPTPTVADSALSTETVVPPVPTPTQAPTTVTDTTPNSGDGDKTLQGVVPNFTTAGKQKKQQQQQGADDNANTQLPNTVVRPAPVPKSPPLKVAHKFATTFVGYEIGEKGAAKQFAATATPKLAKELKQDPPKLPSTGQIPKASVVNVVRGKKSGDSLDVSVSLMRSGAASELRLALTREKGQGWLVSEVRG
ncbi:MAG: hypothetical protein J0H98_03885 [Solirubrobacterales bacterium]|nr:hypothetical protein [Solirubrobacterales bacterium]